MRYERGGCLRESCGIGKGASFPPVESKPRIQSDLNNSFQAPTAVNGTSRGDFTSDAAVAIHASTAQ